MSFVAVAACIVYYAMDRRIARNYDVPQPSASDRFVWSDLWRFDRSFWYVIGLCVTFYSVIFPFRSTFAIKYFQHAHGVSLQEAGALNGYVFLAAIVATPLFGLMADRLGHRAAFMAFGCFLLAAAFPILAYTDANLWITTVMIGIAFSLVPAVIWPAVPYLVEPNRLGTAYGLMTMVQAMGLTVDQSRRRRVERRQPGQRGESGGYTPMLWLFFFLSLFGFVFAYALRVRETGPQGHGLETIKAGGAGLAGRLKAALLSPSGGDRPLSRSRLELPATSALRHGRVSRSRHHLTPRSWRTRHTLRRFRCRQRDDFSFSLQTSRVARVGISWPERCPRRVYAGSYVI